MMNDQNYPGARWWKFDFHTHTPASSDFRGPECTPEEWLRAFMQKEIDCVAITDHNSGAWVNQLKGALEKIEQQKPEWYRPIWLFPGVEISSRDGSGGVHLLAIFDSTKNTEDIDSLLGAVEYRGTKGKSDAVAEKPLDKMIDCIVEYGGIAIPAHADKAKGVFEELRGNTLRLVLDTPNVYAVEIVADGYPKPQLYREKKLDWTEVRGSDMHGSKSERFGVFTWVKMEKPSIEGLKLALIDGGPASVIRDMQQCPNEHAELYIASMQVNKTQFMGRKDALECKLSPFLNTIIGGHGSGKSSLLEFMRLALRRENELPDNIRSGEKENYFRAGEDGLLTESSELQLTYHKGGTQYRLNWAENPTAASIQVLDGGAWRDQDGEITSLFPVRIYSQKQINDLANKPQGLLKIIDEAESVDFETYQQTHQNLEHRYKSVCLQLDQMQQKVQEESKFKGLLNDLNQQIAQIEQSGHKTVLQNYRRRCQQLHEIEKIEKHWDSMRQSIGESLEDADAPEIDHEVFASHPQILETLQQKQQQWQQQVSQIEKNLAALAVDLRQWKSEKNQHDWMKSLNTDMQEYERLQQRLQQQGIDPDAYSALLQQRATSARELESIRDDHEKMEKAKKQSAAILDEIENNRRQLTRRRLDFLAKRPGGSSDIVIEIHTFKEAWETVEEKIREVLRLGNSFDADVAEVQAAYESAGHAGVKAHIKDIHNETVEAKDLRFKKHLQKLRRESKTTDFSLWLPEDALHVTYGPNRKKLSTGSPGQKSAALLAFILSYGNEPLLLDQPEDDLDHGVISTIIVEALKVSKPKRQIIVVTHNANIVVNGDSEMVHSLTVDREQTQIQSASLQLRKMRDQICDTVEGGRKALEQRYKRIHLE